MSLDLPRRVVILLHARDRRAEERPYIAWGLREAWAREGVEVVVSRGAASYVEADAAVNHVDLTTTPETCRAILARYRLAVNGRCVEISKRRVSTLLLGADDAWDGPVIVKTDANCGGKPEARLRGRSPGAILGAAARSAWGALGGRGPRARARWRTVRRLSTDRYPVFPSLAAVPPGVFENPALVVERFVPEREGDLYALRTWYVLGDRSISRRVLSTEPIVKAGGIVRREDVEVHPEAVAVAARLGLDYGKVDYVVHDGRASILDVNRTPTFGPRLDERGRRWTNDRLAPGLAALWARVRAGTAS